MTLEEAINLIEKTIDDTTKCKCNKKEGVDTYEISVRSNGKKTRASLKHNGKPVCSAKATTHPEDEEDLFVGTSLALKRLFNKVVEKDELEDIKDFEKGRAEQLIARKMQSRHCTDLNGNLFNPGDIVKIYMLKGGIKELEFDYDKVFKFPFNTLKNGWAYDSQSDTVCVVINESANKCKCKCGK